MKRKYVIGIDGSGINEAIKGVKEYQRWIVEKTEELCKRLGDLGYEFSYQVLANHIYSGETIGSLTVEERSPTQYVVRAESKAILFLEFGAGLIGYGHPEPGNFGPGTYPGKGHWNDPGGWWFETDDPNLAVRKNDKTGKMYGHSYGTPPYMPMYNSVRSLRDELADLVKEVFK